MLPVTRSRAIALLVACLVLAGCASGASPSAGSLAPTTAPSTVSSSTPGSGAIAYATGPTDLVVRASSGGGLLPPRMRLTQMPDVSIYGNGHIVQVGAHGSAPADPLLPGLAESRISSDGLVRILGAARDAGLLGEDRRYELPDVYDLWSVTFTVTADGRTHSTWVYALGFSDELRFAPPADHAARKVLGALYGQLLDLRAWLGPDLVGEATPYTPAALRMYLAPVVEQALPGQPTPPPVTPRPGQDVRAWPLGSPPGAFGVAAGKHWNGWRCAVLTWDAAAPFGLATATHDTRWRAGDQLYELVIRPLLPEESGCPDLG